MRLPAAAWSRARGRVQLGGFGTACGWRGEARTGAGGVPIHLRDRTPRTWL